jgi:hypothetical protein
VHPPSPHWHRPRLSLLTFASLSWHTGPAGVITSCSKAAGSGWMAAEATPAVRGLAAAEPERIVVCHSSVRLRRAHPVSCQAAVLAAVLRHPASRAAHPLGGRLEGPLGGDERGGGERGSADSGGDEGCSSARAPAAPAAPVAQEGHRRRVGPLSPPPLLPRSPPPPLPSPPQVPLPSPHGSLWPCVGCMQYACRVGCGMPLPVGATSRVKMSVFNL